jgi:hypothetical protein
MGPQQMVQNPEDNHNFSVSLIVDDSSQIPKAGVVASIQKAFRPDTLVLMPRNTTEPLRLPLMGQRPRAIANHPPQGIEYDFGMVLIEPEVDTLDAMIVVLPSHIDLAASNCDTLRFTMVRYETTEKYLYQTYSSTDLPSG